MTTITYTDPDMLITVAVRANHDGTLNWQVATTTELVHDALTYEQHEASIAIGAAVRELVDEASLHEPFDVAAKDQSMPNVPKTTKRLEPLDILANGYTVIAVRDGTNPGVQVVLAVGGPTNEYVTWIVQGRENTFWGHYHNSNIEQAATDFRLRSA